jgi:hypothetical protein
MSAPLPPYSPPLSYWPQVRHLLPWACFLLFWICNDCLCVETAEDLDYPGNHLQWQGWNTKREIYIMNLTSSVVSSSSARVCKKAKLKNIPQSSPNIVYFSEIEKYTLWNVEKYTFPMLFLGLCIRFGYNFVSRKNVTVPWRRKGP